MMDPLEVWSIPSSNHSKLYTFTVLKTVIAIRAQGQQIARFLLAELDVYAPKRSLAERHAAKILRRLDKLGCIRWYPRPSKWTFRDLRPIWTRLEVLQGCSKTFAPESSAPWSGAKKHRRLRRLPRSA